jgi:hypothetical protein
MFLMEIEMMNKDYMSWSICTAVDDEVLVVEIEKKEDKRRN